jgi:hypothetical protein
MDPRPHTLTLLKADGTKIEDILALVHSEIIFIDNERLPIEKGDKFTRFLANGTLKEYRVLEPGYYKYPSPHYQVVVEKL